MLQVLSNTWALLLGMFLLMIGNGLQGTLLGVRGEIEGFSNLEMSIVMSAYFVGFLGASRVVPEMIRRVGHVRVFAALGSFVSAVLILYPAIPHPVAWAIGRAIIGFSFCGVYVTAESWLNNGASNENRGQALSLYMVVQMIGIVSAQGMLLLADPSGYILFVVISVLVSISFAPILLSISPTPAFEATKADAIDGIDPRLAIRVSWHVPAGWDFCGPVWHGRDLWIANWPKPERDFGICCLVLCWGHVAAISHWLGV